MMTMLQFSLPHQKQELKPMSKVETENGSISRGSQSIVSMVRDLWSKGFSKNVSFEFRAKEWWTEKVEKRKVD